MRAIRALPFVFLTVACSSKSTSKPLDAPSVFDGASDAPSSDAPSIDAPTPPPGCDYGELDDVGNDYNGTPAGVAEQTMIGFTSSSVICGSINNGHYDSTRMSVDTDSFLFTVINDADVMVTFVAPGAEALQSVAVYLFDPSQQATVATGLFVGDHAILIAHVPAGVYELDMEASNVADAATAIAYKAKITTDTPAARCVKVTAAANYTEAHDLASNDGNDMINIAYAATPAATLTVSTTDAPEPSALTLNSATSYRITGNSANVNPADDYMDRDTYAIKTGATTNQLSIRLNWPGTTSDLDFYLFEANTVNEIGSSTSIGNMEDEFTTIAVKPNTNYWFWVAQYDTATNPTAVTYDASICGETFTP
jgi:hypothetical protein